MVPHGLAEFGMHVLHRPRHPVPGSFRSTCPTPARSGGGPEGRILLLLGVRSCRGIAVVCRLGRSACGVDVDLASGGAERRDCL